MNADAFFAYMTHHSDSLIQWELLVILVLSGIIIAIFLVSAKSAQPSEAAAIGMSAPSPELAGMLAKIMEQTTKLESLNLKGMPAADVAAVDAQVQTLKKDIAAREAEINALKAAGPSKASDDAAGLGARIKELEAKLAEYEILEDDIADLSLYKEENLRLRGELEKVKAGGGDGEASGADAAAVSAIPLPEVPAPESNEAIVAEFAQAMEAPVPAAQPTASAPPSANPAPAAVGKIPDTGDPMADFESTVQLEKKLTGQEPIPAPAATAPAAPLAPAPVAVAPEASSQGAAPRTSTAEADDLFAEFAEPAADADTNLAGGALDTDKMMAEMAALVGMESSGSSLEESIDIEKMAAEAGGSHKS